MGQVKSITIHQMDDQLARMIEAEAKKRGTSKNKVIKTLLAQSLGMKPSAGDGRRDAFAEFSGIWSADDLATFTTRTADFERVDTDDWR